MTSDESLRPIFTGLRAPEGPGARPFLFLCNENVFFHYIETAISEPSKAREIGPVYSSHVSYRRRRLDLQRTLARVRLVLITFAALSGVEAIEMLSAHDGVTRTGLESNDFVGILPANVLNAPLLPELVPLIVRLSIVRDRSVLIKIHR